MEIELHTKTDKISFSFWVTGLLSKALALVCAESGDKDLPLYPYFKATGNNITDIYLGMGSCDCNDCIRAIAKERISDFLNQHKDETVIVSFGCLLDEHKGDITTCIQYLDAGVDWPTIRKTLLSHIYHE